AEVEVAASIHPVQRGDKLPAKHPTEDFDGQEEAGVFRPNPAPVIRRQAASRDDAVDMRMADERLAPRVEDAQNADLRAEMARVGGDLLEGGGTGLKEPRVQTRAVPIDQRQERMGQGEDDVHIWQLEELPLAGVEPPFPRLRLALRTVPIATRVIGDGLVSAGATPIEMSTQGGGATARDRPKD